MTKKYLITGGTGFIGSHLTDKLLEQGYEVHVLDNGSGNMKSVNEKAIFHKADICNFEEIRPLFKGIDYVFHLAALPRVPFSVIDPVTTSKVNILGAINVFKASSEANVKRVVFASSSSVYGAQDKDVLKEDMTPNPVSPYGLQKQVGEQFAKMFSNLYGTPIVSLRYFNVYGEKIDFDSEYSLILGRFLKLKSEGKPLTIYGDGEQTRSFCYVDDVVSANIKATESEKIKGGEVINIGHQESYSINYLAKLIGGEVEYLPPRTGDPLHTKSDISLAKELLDWEPKVGFAEGVKIVKDWFEKEHGAHF